jgi:outer membrane protein OmpA-like peptidoglycan-associated protein
MPGDCDISPRGHADSWPTNGQDVYAQLVTAGARAHLADRCSVLAAVDVGLQGRGFAYGPPMPAWNAIAGFSYTFERDEAHAHVSSTPAPDAPPPAVAAIEAPLPEVLVTPVAAVAVPARVSVSAFDADGTAVSGFTTTLASADGALKGTPRADGGFDAAVGTYVLHVEANGLMSRDREVRVESGEKHTVELLLRSEAPPSVKLTSSAIELGEPIVFGHKDAQILPQSREILAIVIDVLAKHPEIRALSIEGHTDDVGPAKKNFELSSARALAVRSYLGAHGVDASRLRSMGYGVSKPLVPNRSAASRARNRRVEFRIVE